MEGCSWNKVFILFCLAGTHTGRVVCNTPFIVSKLIIQESIGTRPVLCFTGSSLKLYPILCQFAFKFCLLVLCKGNWQEKRLVTLKNRLTVVSVMEI